jgi:hypothetical protein
MRSRPDARQGIALFAAISLVAAGCGGGEDGAVPRPPPIHTESDATAVIRAWADTLRHGDLHGAARFFAVPSLVSNGTPPTVLHNRADVLLFNASLPCGARLVSTSSAGRYTTAVFKLTERPGAGRCGAGTGLTARTTFVIRDGKIQEWRRVPDEPTPSGRTV